MRIVAIDPEDPFGEELTADTDHGTVQPKPFPRENAGVVSLFENISQGVGDGHAAQISHAEEGHGPADGGDWLRQTIEGAVNQTEQAGHQGGVHLDHVFKIFHGGIVIGNHSRKLGDNVGECFDIFKSLDKLLSGKHSGILVGLFGQCALIVLI